MKPLASLLFPLSLLLAASAMQAAPRPKLTDHNATKETKALYRNLNKLAKKHILFGHQHATEYGHGWQGDSARSDVKSVTGSNPAVVGVDFSGLSGRPPEAIERTKASLRKQITDTYDRGGVTTVAWHFSNPVTPKTGFYWKDSVSALPRVRRGLVLVGQAALLERRFYRALAVYGVVPARQFAGA